MNSWHVAPEIWDAYLAGRLDAAAESSVETHVATCGHCRSAARAYVNPAETQEIWQAVQTTVTTPRIAPPLRWLRRLGVPERELVLLGAADAVTLPWATAVGAAIACALVSMLSGLRYEPVFLGLAPLVPVLAVVAAFDATDSLREVSAATPYSKLRLALIRTTTALAVALPVTMVVGLLVPNLESLAFAWLLPGLGLTTSALVLLTWFTPRLAGGAVSILWVAGIAVAGRTDRLDLVTGPHAQTVFAAAAVALALVFVLRTTSWRGLGGAD